METLSAILKHFMERARVGSQRLSKLTGLPRTSIDNWRAGTAQRPQQWQHLLQIASALALTSAEVDMLLSAAAYPPLATLIDDPSIEPADHLRLSRWLSIAAPTVSDGVLCHPSALPTNHDLPFWNRHQLRAPTADFTGNQAVVATLIMKLRSATRSGAIAPIAGISGMGGLGKTELCYLVANHLCDDFPDAQIVVDLHGTRPTPRSPEQALQHVILAFTQDERLPSDLSALQRIYCSVLHGRRVLILADDARDAAHVRHLIPPPGCALLITSRTRFTLPGMLAIDLDHLSEPESIALLQHICGRLNNDDARTIASVCGYLPLALRVSGSMLHSNAALPVAEYIRRLADERSCLGQLHDPDDPQLNVETSLALSYTLLEGPVQHVFRQLGIFTTHFSTTMATQVISTSADIAIVETLWLLLRRNLIRYDARQDRWHLHDLVRALALRRLRDMQEEEAARLRYARTALQFAAEAQEQYLAGGDGVTLGLARFDAERAHIDAARTWAQAHAATPTGDALLLTDIAATITIGDLRYDERHERVPQLLAALDAARRTNERGHERTIVNRLGIASYALGDITSAITYYRQTLDLARAIDDQRGEVHALGNLGIAYRALGESERAITYYEDALRLAQIIGDQRGEGTLFNNLGAAHLTLGNLPTARGYLEQALTIARATGNRRSEGFTLNSLGNACAIANEIIQAINYQEQALTIAHATGNRRLEGLALMSLGQALATSDHKRASVCFEQAIDIFHALGDRGNTEQCNWHFGLALLDWGERTRALPYLRTAVAYEQTIGHTHANTHAALLSRCETEEPAII